jgi:molecular chaperone GrpE
MDEKKPQPSQEDDPLAPEEPAGEVPESEVFAGAEAEEKTASGGTGDDASGELLRRLDEAEERAKSHEERYLRTVADLENFRRRAAKEREELRDVAVASLVEDLLPALDNLRLGLQAADNHPEAKDVAYGFRMVADQLRKTLESYGLEELSPDGETFDPNLHDCMSHLPHAEVPEGGVIETVRPGFRLKNRLLRPASVTVSSGPGDAADGESDTEEAPGAEPDS